MKQLLEAPYSGPHEIVSFNHELNTAQIKGNGLIQTVSIQRLKQCKLPLAVKESNEPKISTKVSQINNNVETQSILQERYCLCNEPYNRAMLKGCNKNWFIEWFHLDCVALRAHPKSSWLCSTCKSPLSVKHVRIDSDKLSSD